MIVRSSQNLFDPARRARAHVMRRPVARVRTKHSEGLPGDIRRQLRPIRGTRYYQLDPGLSGLDFSFKKLIPKPLRKIKPLKILGSVAKVAIPVAVGGVAALGAKKLIGGLLARKGVPQTEITPGPPLALPTDVFSPPIQETQQVYVQPVPYQPAVSPVQGAYAYPAQAPADTVTQGVDASGAGMPGWIIPAAIGAGIFLLAGRGR